MKTSFTISRNKLLASLLRCKYAINIKNALPGMQDFLFSFDEGRLVVAGTDGENVIRESIKLDSCDASDNISFGMYPSYLLNAIKSLDEQPLSFELYDYQVKVIHNCGSFWLPKDDVESIISYVKDKFDFNKYVSGNQKLDVKQVTLEIPGIKHWIDLCFNSLAHDELRPVMNYICMDFLSDNQMRIVASDGYQLVKIEKEIEDIDFDAKLLLSRRACQIIQKCLPKTGIITLFFTPYIYSDEGEQKSAGKFNICLDPDDDKHTLDVAFRFMDGIYPNYMSVIPQRFNYEMKCDRLSLLKSVNRLIQFSNESSHRLTLKIETNKLTISGEDINLSIGATEELLCDLQASKAYADTLKIGLKVTTLASVLKRQKSEKLIFSLIDHSYACIISPEPQPSMEKITFLMMPMYLGD